MIISISPTLYDIDGPLVIKDRGSMRAPASRRVQRTATIAGGVIIADGGFVDGDRTFVITIQSATRTEIARAKSLQRNFATVLISWSEGIFRGTISNIALQQSNVILTILIKERIAGE